MTFLTPEQYLEIERKADGKSEYFHGDMFAMSGGSPNHSLVIGNTIGTMWPKARARACRTYTSDLRVHVPATGLYTYPDVSFVCGELQLLEGHNDVLLNPTVIVEVLSPSTEAYDRGRKFVHYRSLESLREYLLISSERVSVDLLHTTARWALAPHLRRSPGCHA